MNNTQRINALENRMDSMESKLDKIIDLIGNTKSAPKTSKKSSGKKSAEAKPQTRAERLTQKYGDLEVRTEYINLRKKVADELTSLYKADGKLIPSKKYKETLNNITVSLNGKFNKAQIKKMRNEVAVAK